MKRIIQFLSIAVFIISFQNAKTQDFSPFINDNFAGVTGMFYNPASIAASRYKFDMEVLGFANRIIIYVQYQSEKHPWSFIPW